MAQQPAGAHAHAAPGKYTPSQGTKTIYAVAMFIGLLLFSLALYQDQTRAWHSYLTAFFMFTSLALGGLFFTAINHATNAGWSVNIRRFAEALTAFLPIAAVAAIVFAIGAKHLYVWLDPEVVAKDAILMGKSGYLNMTFFVVRLAVFFGAWLIFRKVLIGNSIAQDKDGNESHTVRNARVSIGFLLVFALSYSFFAVDATMSLQPHWYSTMWGVYCFAGLFQSSLAALCILTVYMMHKGLVRGLVSDEHLHDLGKYLMAFTVFYAYIGFSQFLLIWYANLPEETIFFLARSSGGWMGATLGLLIFKFIIPFLLLLPKGAKRNHGHLVLVSCLILVMQYVDVHWQVYPTFSENWIFSWQELGTILLFGGGFLWATTNFLAHNNVVPVQDPRREESIHHHVTY
jgi:hypothetical protein